MTIQTFIIKFSDKSNQLSPLFQLFLTIFSRENNYTLSPHFLHSFKIATVRQLTAIDKRGFYEFIVSISLSSSKCHTHRVCPFTSKYINILYVLNKGIVISTLH